MRETQREALELFSARGFDAVTVDEIAATLDIAASTVYRHFGTKEAIVLWDEHEAELDDSLDRELRSKPPLHAVRDAFVGSLAPRYDDDLGFQLKRVSFIFATEAVHAAAVEADFAARDELTAALRKTLARSNRDAAPIIAGAALLALDIALDRWQQAKGKKPLGALITDAFAPLDHLGSIR